MRSPGVVLDDRIVRVTGRYRLTLDDPLGIEDPSAVALNRIHLNGLLATHRRTNHL
jgi:hypothetical protein